MSPQDQIKIEAYSKLVELIYDTAQTPVLWPELFQSIDEHKIAFSDEPQAESLKHLEPHLTKAIKIHSYINNLESKSDTADHIINRLPMGVVIVSQDAEIIALNQRAQTYLDDKECLAIENNHIVAHHNKSTQALHHAITNAITQQTGVSLQIKLDHEQHTSIWVTSYAEKGNAPAIKIALYIVSPSIKPEYHIESIAQDFQLTQAQAKLVALLANGCHNLNDIATKLGVSIHTVRSQIKTVYEKTDTNCQVELVKKILTSPAAIVGQAQPPAPFQPQRKTTQPPPQGSIALFDGRRLGYVEYGNPDGEPVVFCHPLIHPDKQMFHEPQLQDLVKYRIIAPKRPGFLNSTPTHKKYSLHDHARDIIQLVDHLGIDTFKVIASSNGAPFAAALAHDYPQRVSQLLLISPIVPPHMDKLTSITTNNLLYKAGKYLPRAVFNQMTLIGFKSLAKRPDELISNNDKYVSNSERAFSNTPALRDYLKQWVKSSYPTRIPAVNDDLLVRIRKWRFKPEDIKVPVFLWHAKDDTTVDIACAKKLASTIPNCQTHYLEEGGHFIFFTHFDEITKTF